MSSGPDISVILVTPDRYHTLRKTMGFLHRQSIRERMEVVIVAPSAAGLEFDPAEVPGFFAVRVVEFDGGRDYARAKVAGVLVSTAPIVAFGEDHCYPAPNWARYLVERHREDYAVVCGAFVNPNPRTALSWAQMFCEYGTFMEPHPGGELDMLAGNNSAYKRDVLLACGDRMAEMLDSECVFHWQLHAAGRRLYLEPRARSFHLNMSRLGPFCNVALHAGGLFAHARVQGWNWPRRLLYAGASPLIPFVRFARSVANIRRCRMSGPPLGKVVAGIFLLLGCSAAGECLGYLGLAARSRERIYDYHFHRHLRLAEHDRQTVEVTDNEPALAES